MLGYKLSNSVALHSTSKLGISCLDVHPDNDDFIISGGFDGTAVVFNKALDKVKSNKYVLNALDCWNL